VAVDVLSRMAAYTGDETYRQPVEPMLAAMAPVMQEYPSGFSHWLCVLAFNLGPPREIALIGDPAALDTHTLLDVVSNAYRPHQVVALGAPDDEQAADTVPLLAHRPQLNGQATAYICQRFVCQAPTVDAASLTEQISWYR
jgi:uncharacterized protein YyaL (SSP411 family)